MKKVNHLIKTQDFAAVYEARKKFISPNLSIYTKKNDLGYLRVGLSVSKKVGKAHIRVKVRRQLRAMMDTFNHYERSYDLVIVVRPSFVDISYQSGYQELTSVLGQCLKEKSDEKND